MVTSAQMSSNSALVPSLKDLSLMRRYVPYLKGLTFHKTSLQNGDAKSSFKGRGMEFEEVRAYNYGDDIRDIDWRVTARKNEPYTKLYAEEKDRQIYLWLDMSASMRFGTRHELKSVTAAKTAALIGWFTLQHKDRFGILIFDGRETHIIDARRTQAHLLAALKKIEKTAQKALTWTQDTTQKEKSLQLLQQKAPNRSIVFIVSSLTDISEKMGKTLSSLAKQNEMFLINIFDALEDVTPPKGEYLAEYEGQFQLLVSSGNAFEEIYQTYFAEKRAKIRQFCAKFNCQYREIRSDMPIYTQLKPI